VFRGLRGAQHRFGVEVECDENAPQACQADALTIEKAPQLHSAQTGEVRELGEVAAVGHFAHRDSPPDDGEVQREGRAVIDHRHRCRAHRDKSARISRGRK
jgi:hypothetical protein